MDKLTKERLHTLSHAWQKNTSPRYPYEFNAFLPLLDEDGNAMTTIAKIMWNPVRGYYEMKPVVEVSPGTYSPTELRLSPTNLDQLKTLLANLGIHVLLRVYAIGEAVPESQPNLPASLFPTIIET